MKTSSFNVAGVTFEGRQDILDRLYKYGSEHDVSLCAEPENKYDKDAVAVYCQNFKIGYVPRAINRSIKRLRIHSPKAVINYSKDLRVYSATVQFEKEEE